MVREFVPNGNRLFPSLFSVLYGNWSGIKELPLDYYGHVS
jgi:hypothetical protein